MLIQFDSNWIHCLVTNMFTTIFEICKNSKSEFRIPQNVQLHQNLNRFFYDYNTLLSICLGNNKCKWFSFINDWKVSIVFHFPWNVWKRIFYNTFWVSQNEICNNVLFPFLCTHVVIIASKKSKRGKKKLVGSPNLVF